MAVAMETRAAHGAAGISERPVGAGDLTPVDREPRPGAPINIAH